jgi:hypothetical protein
MTNKEKRFLHRIQKLSLIEVLNGTSSNDDLINRHSCVSLTIETEWYYSNYKKSDM